jgi:glutamine synthetase adenylyltransferase
LPDNAVAAQKVMRTFSCATSSTALQYRDDWQTQTLPGTSGRVALAHAMGYSGSGVVRIRLAAHRAQVVVSISAVFDEPLSTPARSTF